MGPRVVLALLAAVMLLGSAIGCGDKEAPTGADSVGGQLKEGGVSPEAGPGKSTGTKSADGK